MAKRLKTRRSPKHSSLSRRSNKARDHKVRDCGTGTRTRAEPVVSKRRHVNNRSGVGARLSLSPGSMSASSPLKDIYQNRSEKSQNPLNEIKPSNYLYSSLPYHG